MKVRCKKCNKEKEVDDRHQGHILEIQKESGFIHHFENPIMSYSPDWYCQDCYLFRHRG
jgi:hypothetical protein